MVFLVGIPPVNKNSNEAIAYLKKTIFIGEKLSSKFLTTMNVPPKNKAESINEETANVFLFLIMQSNED